MKKVAFIGGSFNPPHRAHLALAQAACTSLKLDHVRFTPAFQAPLKDAPQTDPTHRVTMLELAIQDDPRFVIERYEIQQAKVSYTVETLRHFHAQEKEAKLFWIIGADQLAQLHKWKDIDEILSLASFAVAMRPPYDETLFQSLSSHFQPSVIDRLKKHRISMPLTTVSSTEIRARVAAGKTIAELVPAAVEQYILSHGLYRATR